ncbi:MAG: hypothetical protein OEZ31_02360 [Nitrospirota bacterium]|nr:hypothetical protein [Nitrospirota bacterium]
MLIKNKKYFSIGVLLTFGFFGLFMLIITPVFDGRNGLQFADDTFNKLAKGSSYFVPKVEKHNEKFMGKQFSVTIKYDKLEDARRTAQLFTTSGAKVEQQEGTLKIEGDLGKTLAAVIKDSDSMYKNEGEQVKSIYGYDEKRVMKDWWQSLNKLIKALQANKKFEEAEMAAEINKKVVEAGYNFYKIDAVKVSEKAVTMTGLLVFYVLYTIWWGFAIYYLFEGIGLTAKKAKVKKEV